MLNQKMTMETGSVSTSSAVERTTSIVFQPQKLKEIVEIIDLMGNIATRVREDSSGDMGGGKAHQKSGTSARDDAIARAPAVEVMQQKLIQHLRKEMKSIERQAKKAARSNDRSAAWLLSELYRKMRRLSSLIAEILHASTEMIRRFYISVFIDRQPLGESGDSSVQSG